MRIAARHLRSARRTARSPRRQRRQSRAQLDLIPTAFPDVPAGFFRRFLCHQSLDGGRARPHRFFARAERNGRRCRRPDRQRGGRQPAGAARSLPDLVFTANAGLAIGGRVLLSRFRCPPRRARNRGFRHGSRRRDSTSSPPQGLLFEGAGDALAGRGARPGLAVGHGFRSDAAMAPVVAKHFRP